MNRRSWIGLALAAIFGRWLPSTPLVPFPRTYYKLTKYSVGFRISHEMMSDDMYDALTYVVN